MRSNSIAAMVACPSMTASHHAPVWISITGAPTSAAVSICFGSAAMNSETRMPAAFSSAMIGTR